MASLLSGSLVGLVEDPRPLHGQTNTHPYHQHPLIKISVANKGRWTCQLCSTEKIRAPALLYYLEDPADHSVSYSCQHCGLDLCSNCFHGYLHPFHTHRLKRAMPELVYPVSHGQWRCDSCHTIHPPEECVYHCGPCEIDLCDRCFTGELTHSLHSKHKLTPVNPAILYRLYLSWTCDNCTSTFTASDKTVFYHCQLCQFDLCQPCFLGRKHHLHQHSLAPLPQTHKAPLCNHCSALSSNYICTQETCGYTLCEGCYRLPLTPHPLHTHPLELCDPRAVYPQSGGLWHCDNCTSMSLGGQQVALSPNTIMYHCAQCEFDLCEPCYKRGMDAPQPTQPYEHLSQLPSFEHLRPLGARPLSYSGAYKQQQAGLAAGSQESHFGLEPQPTAMLCLVCAHKEATHRFIHKGRSCAVVGIVCGGCSENVLFDRRLCPYCKEVPDHAERVS